MASDITLKSRSTCQEEPKEVFLIISFDHTLYSKRDFAMAMEPWPLCLR